MRVTKKIMYFAAASIALITVGKMIRFFVNR